MDIGEKSLTGSLMNSGRMYGSRAYDQEISEKYDSIVSDTLRRNQGGRVYQGGGTARVYRDDADRALQAKLENSNSPFQKALQAAEAAGNPTFDFEGKQYAARTDGTAGAGAGNNAGAGAGAGVQDLQLDDVSQFAAPEEVADVYTPGGGGDANPTVDPSWWQQNQSGITRGVGNVASGLLNIAPNIANINDLRNMPGVLPANLVRAQTSEAPSFEASRQAIIAQGRNMANEANYDDTQSNIAERAAAMSGTQSALSRLGGEEAKSEAQTDARNNYAINRANAQNTSILNRNYEQQTSRQLAQMRGIAGQRSAIGNKTLGFLGDINTQKLDREKMDIAQQQFATTNVLQRQLQKDIAANGGKIPDYAADFYGQRGLYAKDNKESAG